jgi:hypothetical protein
MPVSFGRMIFARISHYEYVCAKRKIRFVTSAPPLMCYTNRTLFLESLYREQRL